MQQAPPRRWRWELYHWPPAWRDRWRVEARAVETQSPGFRPRDEIEGEAFVAVLQALGEPPAEAPEASRSESAGTPPPSSVEPPPARSPAEAVRAAEPAPPPPGWRSALACWPPLWRRRWWELAGMLRALASRPLSAERLEGRAFVLAAAEMDEVDALDWRRRLEADPELARAVEEARAERAAGGGPPA